MAHGITQSISQTTSKYLGSAGAGINKAGAWLGKGITEISKSFHHIGAKIAPAAEKTASTALDIFKSPYFHLTIAAIGIALTSLSAKKLWDVSEKARIWKKEYLLPVIGIVAGVTLTAVGIALAAARL